MTCCCTGPLPGHFHCPCIERGSTVTEAIHPWKEAKARQEQHREWKDLAEWLSTYFASDYSPDRDKAMRIAEILTIAAERIVK